MPEFARKYSSSYYRNYSRQYNSSLARDMYYREAQRQASAEPIPLRRDVNSKKVKRNNIIHRIISVLLVSLIGIFVLPQGFNHYVKPLLKGGSSYPYLKADYEQMRFPTANYLSNSWYLGQRSLRGANTTKPLMAEITEGNEIESLKNQLIGLSAAYPSIHPAVYVWNYEDGSYVDINADEIFATASIIKLPVLVQLFRAIESNDVNIYDDMTLTEYFRTEGSGSLQFKAEGSKYSIDDLARVMITESDNSATNMLVAKLGSMTNINSGLRDWGLNKTNIQTWLPDLGGTNKTTAREMARILYNIDNPFFLSTSSREKIFDYMGHVHNNRLIQAGLGPGATFLHKTGDIGSMLGDAGIVYTPKDKKYIVVILANRPHNSPLGKEFIVRASELIYNTLAG